MPLGAHKAAIMGVAGVSTADVVLLYDTDHSGVSSVSITSGIDSTYSSYIFKIYLLNPATDEQGFNFNGSIDGGSNYNVSKTSAAFTANHDEDDNPAAMAYETSQDLPDGEPLVYTGYQRLTSSMSNSADMNGAITLTLFNPSSTTYVKHFYSESADNGFNRAMHSFRAGYFNTTSAIDAIAFKTDAGGAFDATIKMWGVK